MVANGIVPSYPLLDEAWGREMAAWQKAAETIRIALQSTVTVQQGD